MFRNRSPKFAVRPSQVPARSSGPAVEHSETVHVADHASRLKVTCRSGHLHATWQCDCGAAGIASPFVTLETALEAAYAAVGRHHITRHAASAGALACSRC